MKFYQLANGDKIPALGLGTWKSEKGKVAQAVKEALQIGYRHIDCAPIYGNEMEIGQSLKEALDSGSVKREELWVTSKLWNNAHESQSVLPALQKTIDDLQIDYLDLYLIHWPVAFKKNVIMAQTGEDYLSLDDVPLIETWRAMEKCVARGLCKHIGVSNFSQKKLAHLIQSGSIKPQVNQIEAHPLLQQKELFEYCQKEDVLVCAYSPLGSGGEPSLLEHGVVKKIADNRGVSPAQILLGWGVTRGTAVIPKSVNPARLLDNFRGANIELSSQEMEILAKVDRDYRFVDGSFWAIPGSPYTVSGLWDN
ncbi:MAG: Aldo/keto reductase [Chroococcopsis gigantea SAG 12.99]|jgi:alcohol dehydrogenase (NADP+)|nr:aldo/keto reductase [Chlorogloea purpurea SAG 13.99]MDV3001855.1 Aldo/keto reductase [Chroococcopsis gigantea SAG 12.99]